MSIGVIALAAGCGQSPSLPVCARLGGGPMLEYQLFFGRSIPERSLLTDQEWADFVAQIVTPHLPDGFTAFDAEGQWMNPATHRIASEKTKVIVVAVPDTDAAASAIAAVKDAYRTRFHQQSVGMTVHQTCGAF
jgi:hypothetical protein